MGISGKLSITSLGTKTIRRPKKIKKVRFDITNVSLKDLSKTIKEIEDLLYVGYVMKRYKHMPTYSYFYLSIQLVMCMMRFNIRVGPVRTQMTNMQNMNNSDTSTQKTTNLHVWSSDEGELKRINANERELHVCSTYKNESKRIIFNTCYLDESEPKSVHISVNTNKVTDAKNETKDEEPPVTDNSVINAPS